MKRQTRNNILMRVAFIPALLAMFIAVNSHAQEDEQKKTMADRIKEKIVQRMEGEKEGEKKGEANIFDEPEDQAGNGKLLNKAEKLAKDMKKRMTGDIYDNLPFKGSLMFDNNDVEVLYELLNGNDVSLSNDVKINADVPVVAPAFYLNSVIFFNPERWALWVNGKKLKLNTIPGLSVENIRMNKVDFKWLAKNLDYLSPNWQNNFDYVSAGENRYNGKSGYLAKKGNIFVDSNSGEVYFTLAANQSFVSRNMDIEEGVVRDFALPKPNPEAQGSSSLKVNILPEGAK